jgi:DNA-binding transcriptional ArsR family regulator
MDLERAAVSMDALGSPVRLSIYRMLVRTGPEGLTVGRIQQAVGLPRSTLSFHLHRLIEAGLVVTERKGTSLISRANYDAMNELVRYLTLECCSASDAQGEGNVA